jgi:plastocyanin
MKKVAALLVLALAALALVACGSSDDDSTTTTTSGGGAESTNGGATGGAGAKEESSGGGSASTLKFEADPNGQLAFTTTSASTKAGNVTIDFKNPQSLPHDVKIESASGEELGGTETIADGSDSATVELEPGTYTFYCSVPGHREAGMEGTLTVK